MTDFIEHPEILFQQERYNQILEIVSKVIAHPHTAITSHDKHRALVLIRFLSNNDDMVEYLYSQMNEDDFQSVKQIRKSIHG